MTSAKQFILLFYEWSSKRHRSKSILLAAADRVSEIWKIACCGYGRRAEKNMILSTQREKKNELAHGGGWPMICF